MVSGVTPLGTMFTSSASNFAAGGVWPPPPLPPTSISGAPFLAVPLSPTRTPVGGFGGVDLISRLGLGKEVQRCTNEVNINGMVWPPPPLPPVSCEITARIECLERQRILSLEAVREKNFELDAVGAEWKAKVELLEARLRAQATAGSRQAEEAVRNVEFRVRDEMRAEVQGVSETLRRSYQDEIDRLKSDLRQAEAKINELESGYGRRDTIIIEDLSRQLEAMTNERDLLSTDNVHLKKANAQREQESSTLRVMLNEERKHLKLLENERDTLKADIEAQRARARLDRDEEVLRQSFSSQTNIYESNTRNSRGSLGVISKLEQPTFSVDLTAVQESFSPRRSSTGSFSQIRRVVELEEYDD